MYRTPERTKIVRITIKLTPDEVWKALMAHLKEKGKIPESAAEGKTGWGCDLDVRTAPGDRHFSVWYEEEVPVDGSPKKDK